MTFFSELFGRCALDEVSSLIFSFFVVVVVDWPAALGGKGGRG